MPNIHKSRMWCSTLNRVIGIFTSHHAPHVIKAGIISAQLLIESSESSLAWFLEKRFPHRTFTCSTLNRVIGIFTHLSHEAIMSAPSAQLLIESSESSLSDLITHEDAARRACSTLNRVIGIFTVATRRHCTLSIMCSTLNRVIGIFTQRSPACIRYPRRAQLLIESSESSRSSIFPNKRNLCWCSTLNRVIGIFTRSPVHYKDSSTLCSTLNRVIGIFTAATNGGRASRTRVLNS